MKNKEKYAKEIIEIATRRESFGIRKDTLEPVSCWELQCKDCLGAGDIKCKNTVKEWSEAEYGVEMIFSNLNPEYKSLAEIKKEAYEQGRKDEAEKQQIECADCIRQITASDEERIRKDERIKFAEWILRKDLNYASSLSVRDLARIYVDDYEAEHKKGGAENE